MSFFTYAIATSYPTFLITSQTDAAAGFLFSGPFAQTQPRSVPRFHAIIRHAQHPRGRMPGLATVTRACNNEQETRNLPYMLGRQ